MIIGKRVRVRKPSDVKSGSQGTRWKNFTQWLQNEAFALVSGTCEAYCIPLLLHAQHEGLTQMLAKLPPPQCYCCGESRELLVPKFLSQQHCPPPKAAVTRFHVVV